MSPPGAPLDATLEQQAASICSIAPSCARSESAAVAHLGEGNLGGLTALFAALAFVVETARRAELSA
jgi:hypothetical protein